MVKKSTILAIFISLICVICFISYKWYLKLKNPLDYIALSYHGDNIGWAAGSETYIGVIGKGSIKIESRDGKQISSISFEKLGFQPGQIALGENYYYVLEYAYSEERENQTQKQIVQLDFKSNIVNRMSYPSASYITCRNGYLFIGKRLEEDEKSNVYNYRDDYVKGFIADSYIKEEDFGKEVTDIELSSSGTCEVGGITLYQNLKHIGGKCISTEPEIEGYLYGCRSYQYANTKSDDWCQDLGDLQDRDWGLLDVEYKNLVLKRVPKGLRCSGAEYRHAGYIYGVCNCYENLHEKSSKIPYQKINYSFAYKINGETREMEMIDEFSDRCLLVVSDMSLVYLKDNIIYQKNRKTASEKKLYTMKHIDGASITVTKDILNIQYGDLEKKGDKYLFWDK